MAKRTKHVFSSYDPMVERWLSQTQDWGKCRNLSFEGNTAFSYREPIARIFPSIKVALFDEKYENYTQTTSRHWNTCHWHIENIGRIEPHEWISRKREYKKYKALAWHIFIVPSLTPNHQANLDFYYQQLKDKAQHFLRTVFHGKWTLTPYIDQRREMKDYAKVFGLKLDPFAGYELNFRSIRNRIKYNENTRRQQSTQNWNGVFIPKWLFTRKTLKPQDIFRIRNAQARTEFLKRIEGGAERVINDLGEIIETQGNYQLVIVKSSERGRWGATREMSRPYLKMVNPSTGENHIEGVHPCCENIADAIMYRRYGNQFVAQKTNRPIWQNRQATYPEEKLIMPIWKPEIIT